MHSLFLLSSTANLLVQKSEIFLVTGFAHGLGFGGISDNVEKVVVVPSLDIAPPPSLLSANKCKPHRGKKE
jgi:hypothetical protein